jgi:hypothetical protein
MDYKKSSIIILQTLQGEITKVNLPIIGLLTKGEAINARTTINLDLFGLFFVTTLKLSTICTQKDST